jgi:uncharacterized membrane protein
MKNHKRVISNIIEIAIGIALSVLGYSNAVDEYWGGMGTALIFVGCISLLRQVRYHKNEEYKEKVDIESNDERNRYLRMKAWSCTGYIFVLIAAVASIMLKIMGLDQYSLVAGYCVCIMVVLYWISFLLLRRKY